MAIEIAALRVEFAALGQSLNRTVQDVERLSRAGRGIGDLNNRIGQTSQGFTAVAANANQAASAVSGVTGSMAGQAAAAGKAIGGVGSAITSSTAATVLGMGAVGAAIAATAKDAPKLLGGGMSDAMQQMISESNRAALTISGVFARMTQDIQETLKKLKGPSLDTDHLLPGRDGFQAMRDSRDNLQGSPYTASITEQGASEPRVSIRASSAETAAKAAQVAAEILQEQEAAATKTEAVWVRAWQRIAAAFRADAKFEGDVFSGAREEFEREIPFLIRKVNELTARLSKGLPPVEVPRSLMGALVERVQKGVSDSLAALRRLPGQAKAILSDFGAKVRGAIGPVTGLLGSLGVGLSFSSFVSTVDEAQDALNRVQSSLKSTGNVVGLTTGQIFEMAGKIQHSSRLSAQEILRAQSVLLTFNQIGGAAFERVTQAAVDMSARFGTDLKGSAVQLGKALQDPIAGVASLREVGVTMTKAQEDQIKAFVKSGKVAEAHNVILTELEAQVKGAAQASRDTLGGALAAMKNNLSDTIVAFAEGNNSANLLTGAIEGLSTWITSLQDNIPALTGVVAGLGVAIGTVAVVATAAWIAALGPLGIALAVISAAIVGLGYVLGDALGELDTWIKATGEFEDKNFSVWQKVVALITVGADSIANKIGAMRDYVVAAFGAMLSNIGTFGKAIGQILTFDHRGLAKTLADGMVSVADSAKKAYDDKIDSFDWNAKMREHLGKLETEAPIEVADPFPRIPTGAPVPPPVDRSAGAGAGKNDTTIRDLTAEAANVGRLNEAYKAALAAKVQLNAITLRRLANPADSVELDRQIIQLEKQAKAVETLQGQLEVEGKLRGIKAAAGSKEYQQQEALIRQQAAAAAQQKKLQAELEAAGQVGGLGRQEQSARVAASAYEIVAKVAEDAARAGYAQGDAIAKATQEAERTIAAYEAMAAQIDISIDKESQFHAEAIRLVQATTQAKTAREDLNRAIEAGKTIADYKQDATDILAIAQAYAVSTDAGRQMERSIENENWLRSLNLGLLGEQGRLLEDLARKALDERDAAEAYRERVEATRGAWSEYTETLMSATDTQRNLQDVAGSTIGGIEDTLVSAASTGKLAFADLAQSIISDLMRVMIRALILKPILAALGMGGAPVPAASGAILPMASGGRPDLGGQATGRMISTPTLLPSRSGPVKAGEAGEEAIFPLRVTPQGKLGIEGTGGGGDNINYNVSMVINPAPNESPEQTARTAREMQRHMDGYFDARIADHKRSRGLLAGGGIRG